MWPNKALSDDWWSPTNKIPGVIFRLKPKFLLNVVVPPNVLPEPPKAKKTVAPPSRVSPVEHLDPILPAALKSPSSAKLDSGSQPFNRPSTRSVSRLMSLNPSTTSPAVPPSHSNELQGRLKQSVEFDNSNQFVPTTLPIPQYDPSIGTVPHIASPIDDGLEGGCFSSTFVPMDCLYSDYAIDDFTNSSSLSTDCHFRTISNDNDQIFSEYENEVFANSLVTLNDALLHLERIDPSNPDDILPSAVLLQNTESHAFSASDVSLFHSAVPTPSFTAPPNDDLKPMPPSTVPFDNNLKFPRNYGCKRSSVKRSTIDILHVDSPNVPENYSMSAYSCSSVTNDIIDDLPEFSFQIIGTDADHEEFLTQLKAQSGKIHSLRSAIKFDRLMTAQAVDVELRKIFNLKALSRASVCDIKPGDQILDPVSVCRLKTDSITGLVTKMTYRLTVNGAQQLKSTYSETFAGTSDQHLVALAKSATYAHAVKTGTVKDFFMSDLDITGAFLHADYVSTTGSSLFIRLPANLPGPTEGSLHPDAGQLFRIDKAMYGLPESNMLFDKLKRHVLSKAGFTPTETDPSIFTKFDLVTGARSILFTHVDDLQLLSNCKDHWILLVKTLEEHFGKLSINENSTQHVGINHISSSSGAYMSNQSGFISTIIKDLGINNLETPRSECPSGLDFFDAPTDTTPVEIKFYQKLIGCLIYCLHTRHDVRKEIIFLAGKVAAPVVSDLIKVTRVLRYLNDTPELGPVFYTEEGPVLIGYADAALANHVDFKSHGAYMHCFGHFNAPFCCHSSRITSCTALSSMEAEYITLSDLARKTLYLRTFLSEIGFTQSSPTVLYEDNLSAIHLAMSSTINKRSRHILIRYHFIKHCILNGHIKVEHIRTEHQRADFLTKTFSKKAFLANRSNLLNLSSLPLIIEDNNSILSPNFIERNSTI